MYAKLTYLTSLILAMQGYTLLNAPSVLFWQTKREVEVMLGLRSANVSRETLEGMLA